MAGRKRALPKLVEAGRGEAAPPRRQNRVNLVELAYERIEDLIVNCELKPGRFLAIQDLQEMTGFSRTPVHQAVTRLANDTLILVRPRHGVQIAPIDLARERVLLQLRRDLERFVIRLAAEKSSPTHRNQLLHVARVLRERRDGMTAGEFNVLDRRIDRLILTAAAEPFLHHTHIKGDANVHTTIDCHLAVLDAVANRHVAQAMTASDALIDFVDSMFDTMEREVDPSLLDCSLEPLIPNPRKDT
jgi:DNA-binding GntR family transcriptional regulator